MDDNDLVLSWAKSQLADAKVPASVGVAVLALLRSWADLNFPNEEYRNRALQIFSALARDEAIVEEGDEDWRPVPVGFFINVGDIVRVRKDAFPGASGRMHNGRIGRVVAKRSGDIIVKTTDGKTPALDSAHYPASVLEKRVK